MCDSDQKGIDRATAEKLAGPLCGAPEKLPPALLKNYLLLLSDYSYNIPNYLSQSAMKWQIWQIPVLTFLTIRLRVP
jgi:hypothetical protein